MMAIRSGFFNSVNGDRKYDAGGFAEYFATFIGNGVFPNLSTNLQVVANNDMTVAVRAGQAWINGYIYINDDSYILDIEPAGGVLNRIDRIVFRYDNMDREIRLKVKKGAFASNPVAPALQRDADAYELGIADIAVNKGIVSITQANITDLRLNNEICGIVHGTVEQVDTTAIFNQFESWYSQTKQNYDDDIATWIEEKKTDFSTWTEDKKKAFDEWYNANTTAFMQQFNTWCNTFTQQVSDWYGNNTNNFNVWFNNLKTILDGDIAGNLYLEIEKVRGDIDKRNLPNNADKYNKISVWADILIPDGTRGKALLEFLLTYRESSLQIAESEPAMLVIMQEERFDKNRQVPFDYDQIIFKLGQTTEAGQYLQWVEELLADHSRGIDKLGLGLMLKQGSDEIAENKYAMRVIMKGESLEGLTSYRRKLANKENLDQEVSRLDSDVTIVDNRLTSEVDRLTIKINKKANK